MDFQALSANVDDCPLLMMSSRVQMEDTIFPSSPFGDLYVEVGRRIQIYP